MAKQNTIFVTKPTLPPLEEVLPYLQDLWSSRIISNGGQYHASFEAKLAATFGAGRVSLVSNATIGLLIALKAMGLKGEVVTTPFSFAATSHALTWCGLTPTFADISRDSLNLDPNRVEEAISKDTSAILPVHCFGNPCDVDALGLIAEHRGLRTVYDAAHAMGVGYKGRSLIAQGDVSVLSFHATKVLNTFEGGAIVTNDESLADRVDCLRNFGILDEETVAVAGINGKMSEFNAVIGLLQLSHLDEYILQRQQVDQFYRHALEDIKGIRLIDQPLASDRNYSHFPIIVEDDYPLTRDQLFIALRAAGVHARKYFYPLISSFPHYKHLPSADPRNLPVATDVVQRILCLPIYPDYSVADQQRVICCIADLSQSR